MRIRITREEAIENLNMISVAFVEPVTKEQRKLIDDTFDMAIKALEQEPKLRQALEQEKGAYNALVKNIQCADAISRQEVLDGIKELKKSPWATDKRGNGFEYLIAEALDVVAELCVKQAPSVNPQEPKTGHWIVHPKGIYAHLVCDKCLSNAPYDCRTNYCPNCGARMIEPQESEVSE